MDSMTAIASIDAALPALGELFGGGRFMGCYLLGTERRALIVAPRADGEIRASWNDSYDFVDSALSYVDGLANTRAMAKAGSDLARQFLELRIGGHNDWCLPALDQLEIIFRAAKPGTQRNSCFARSGINLSALPPTQPYTPIFPEQTALELFRAGGAEAFQEDLYWTSTQYAAYGNYAWAQSFHDGDQSSWGKDGRYFARAVRSEPI